MIRAPVIALIAAAILGPLSSAVPRAPSVAAAQPAPPGGGAGGARPANSLRREEIKRRIRSLRAYALTSELGLDERAGTRLWPILARYDDEIDKLVQQRVEVNRRLRDARQLRDPRALDRLVDDAIANQRAFWSLEERRLIELRRILPPLQVAQLLVVLPAFERKIQSQLRRAIVRRGPAARQVPRARRADRLEQLPPGSHLEEEELDDSDDDVDAPIAPSPDPSGGRDPGVRRR
jgi:hypothetical protein